MNPQGGKSAATEFFNSLPSEAEEKPIDIFEKPVVKQEPPKEVAPDPVVTPEKEEDDGPRQKRRERREGQMRYYEEKLAEERAAREQMARDIEALKSGGKTEEVDQDIKRLLTEVKDPEEATKLFQKMLSGVESKAEEKAYGRLIRAREEEDAGVKQLHNEIQDGIESIEDKYGVDLTGDTTTRNAYLDFVETLSPKNSDEIADMENAWVLFNQIRRGKSPEVTARQKQIASRSMTRSAVAKPTPEGVRNVTFQNIDSLWEKITGRGK